MGASQRQDATDSASGGGRPGRKGLDERDSCLEGLA